MKFISILLSFWLFLGVSHASNDRVELNFKNIKIEDLVRFVGKITGKNVLILSPVQGTVDFVPNRAIKKEDVIDIVNDVLYEKGFALVESRGTIKVIKASMVSRYNLPVVKGNNANGYTQMVTSVIKLKNVNSDLVASKIRHLISKNAKLVTNKESNSLVVTDFPKNIKTIMDVVAMMQQGNDKYSKIVHLENVQATNLLTQLNAISKSMFDQKIQSEKVTIVVDKSINSLIFIGKKGNVLKLAKFAINSDTSDSRMQTTVDAIYLKNADVKAVLKIVNDIVGKKKYIDAALKPTVSADEESNMLVLSGVKDEIDHIRELVKMLDRDKRQVYVKAQIIEVSEKKEKEIGVKYGLLGGKSSATKGLVTFAANLAKGGKALAFDTRSIGLSLPTLTEGLALGASINFMKQNGVLEVVSEPSILCINNKESSIYVGETRSFPTSSVQNTSGNPTTNFSREDIGLSLKIKPRVSNDHKVTLEITTVLEDVDDSTTRVDGAGPNTTKKEIKTTAIVTNGQNVIVGGLIKDKRGNTVDKVPLFGDIPVLGTLFKNDSHTKSKTNLVVIVTPYIIPTSEDLQTLRGKLSKLDEVEARFSQTLNKTLQRRLQHLPEVKKSYRNPLDALKMDEEEY